MRPVDVMGHRAVLRAVDNPANEDRWGDAKAIADRMDWPRRGMTQTLEKLERAGLVESMREDYVPSPRSDPPPLLWRRTSVPMTEGTR